MIGARSSEWKPASPEDEVGWFEVWWDGAEVGQWVVKEAVCQESHRKTCRGEIHPPCVQKQVEQLSGLLLLTFDSPVAETRILFFFR